MVGVYIDPELRPEQITPTFLTYSIMWKARILLQGQVEVASVGRIDSIAGRASALHALILV